MEKRFRRILVASLVTAGMLGAGVPVAFAADEPDPNNRLEAALTLTCKNKNLPVTLEWTSLAPAGTVVVTAKWVDVTLDPGLNHPTPDTNAAAARGVTIKDGKASGTITIPRLRKGNRDGHQILLYVDAYNGDPDSHEPGQTQIGIGRKTETIDCTWPPRR